MLTSLQTLTTHFDLDDLNLDLTPVLRNIYLEIKEKGAIDPLTVSQNLKLRLTTVMSCLKELKSKGYVQEVGDVWVITSDEPPSENDFKIEPDKQEGWNLVEAKETGAISDELLEALETSK